MAGASREADHVFGDIADLSVLWKESGWKSAAGKFRLVIPTKHVPDNPRLN